MVDLFAHRRPRRTFRSAMRIASVSSYAFFRRRASSSPAACRTYNVLLGEGRRVAAALLPVGP
jgi:uncharacterized protein